MGEGWQPSVPKWMVSRVASDGRVEYLHFGPSELFDGRTYRWRTKRNRRLRFDRKTQARAAIAMAESMGLDMKGAKAESYYAQPAKPRRTVKADEIARADIPPPRQPSHHGDVKPNERYL